MKWKALALCVLPVLLAQTALASDPVATFQDARVAHNVCVDGKKGMRIHAKFTVKYGLHVPCKLIAYYHFDDEKGTPLKSRDAAYSDAGGKVSASTRFTPAYDPASYSDLQIFVPYSALNMRKGEQYELKFILKLYDESAKRFFGTSGWYKFHMNVP